MGDGLEAVAHGNSLFQFTTETIFYLHHLFAPRANQMVMMTVVALAKQFVAGNSVSEIKPLYDPQLLQQTR